MNIQAPLFSTIYRGYKIELRMSYHPKGVVAQLELSKCVEDAPYMSFCPVQVYRDRVSASDAVFGEAVGLVDLMLVSVERVEN